MRTHFDISLTTSVQQTSAADRQLQFPPLGIRLERWFKDFFYILTLVFVGVFYSVLLSQSYIIFQYSDTDSSPLDIMEVEETRDFLLSSVVPRLHAVVSFKLEHSNPYLPSFDLSNIGMTRLGLWFIVCAWLN